MQMNSRNTLGLTDESLHELTSELEALSDQGMSTYDLLGISLERLVETLGCLGGGIWSREENLANFALVRQSGDLLISSDVDSEETWLLEVLQTARPLRLRPNILSSSKTIDACIQMAFPLSSHSGEIVGVILFQFEEDRKSVV